MFMYGAQLGHFNSGRVNSSLVAGMFVYLLVAVLVSDSPLLDDASLRGT